MKYFAYCRKSSEDKKRQVLSIQSQQRELERRFGADANIEIVAMLEEERSAMKPGRPVFATLIERIERGEAQGIIAWAPDRLARNSIDGGQIVYLLDLGVICDLKFATYTFENNSQGKFMLQIMFGQSKYYSDALSENVKRGVRTKIENGWWPTITPLGYQNDKETRTITADPERFPLIQKMFHMLLTGCYSVEQICSAAKIWGLRTPMRTKLGGRPLALSTVYKIFYNPFYAGIIPWNGKWYPGKHPPMVSLQAHQDVQAILRRPGRPQPQKDSFAYTGLMRCGSCGFVVTAERKTNRFGSHYVYYHCSWRARPKCHERSVEVKNLEAQFLMFLRRFSISDAIYKRAAQFIDTRKADISNHEDSKRRALVATITDVERRSDQLTDMRARSLIDDGEFTAKREIAQRELMQLREALNECDKSQDTWFEPVKAILLFSNRAASWFVEGTDEEKRLIMHAVGSNLSISGRIANIQARKSYRYIPKKADIPNLRAFVKNIRKMAAEMDAAESFQAVREIVESRSLRGADVRALRSRLAGVASGEKPDQVSAKLPRVLRQPKAPRHIHSGKAA